MSNQTHRSIDWVKDKVAKLLTLGTNDGATPGERDNAMRMAHRLMAKYNLGQAECRPPGERNTVKFTRQYFGRPWARQVSSAMARMLFCEYLYIQATEAKNTTHIFIGREDNASTAASLAEYLVSSITREARRAERASGQGNEYFRSFATAASYEINRRVNEVIAEATKPAQSSEPGTALALISLYQTEEKANKEFLAVAFPKIKRGRKGASNFDPQGAYNGQQYGKSVSLNRQITGGN
jgi:Protein of unknown function (DUF2786)